MTIGIREENGASCTFGSLTNICKFHYKKEIFKGGYQSIFPYDEDKHKAYEKVENYVMECVQT